MKGSSLSRKIQVVSLSGIFLFGSLVGIYSIYKERKDRFASIRSEIIKTGSFLVPHTYILLKQKNPANLLHMTQVVHQNISQGNFCYVEIVDSKGNLLVPYDPLGIRENNLHNRSIQDAPWGNLAIGKNALVQKVIYEDVGPVVEGAFGIVEKDKILGYVILGVSQKPALVSANKNLWRTLLALFFLWLLAIGITWKWNKNKLKVVAQMEKMARYDSMTGLLNRQTLMQKADLEFSRTQRRENSVYLILADLDHFKSINDSYGHMVGDKVICAFAEILSHSRRLGEEVCRFGGEEFLLLLPDTDTQGAVIVAQKILDAVNCASVELGDGEELPFKVSLGVAGYPNNGFSFTEVLRKADKALYLAKSRGRNQMAVWNKNLASTRIPFLNPNKI